MVDKALVAAQVAAVRDATARVRTVLPASPEAFTADRTIREVVILNLLVAIQGCLDLATHWLADAGWEVPTSYAEVFAAVLPRPGSSSGRKKYVPRLSAPPLHEPFGIARDLAPRQARTIG